MFTRHPSRSRAHISVYMYINTDVFLLFSWNGMNNKKQETTYYITTLLLQKNKIYSHTYPLIYFFFYNYAIIKN